MTNHNQNPFLQSFLLFLLVWRVCKSFLKGKSDAVRVAHLHSAARALSSPSRCQINVDNDLCGC